MTPAEAHFRLLCEFSAAGRVRTHLVEPPTPRPQQTRGYVKPKPTRHRPSTNPHGVNRKRPVTIGAVTYPSVTDAARIRHVAVTTIYRLLRDGRAHYVGVKATRGGHNAKAVIVAGQRFSSIDAAAKTLGHATITIKRMVEAGTARYADA